MNLKELWEMDRFFNDKGMSFSKLLEAVEDHVGFKNSDKVLTEDSLGFDSDESISDLLPTIKITEDWGTKGSRDKEIITEFASKIRGETLEDKLNSLANVITGATEKSPTLGEILSTLVMIEVLNSILGEFTEAAGGFIFEGFLAGLFGEKGVQITGAAEGAKEKGKPITDVRVKTANGDIEYSLKLLGKTTDVKGSFSNMIIHFEKYDHVVYLDARRTGSGLLFGEFSITLANFMEVFVTPFLKHVYKKEKETYEDAGEFQGLLSNLIAQDMAVKEIAVGKTGLASGPFAKHSTFEYGPKTGSTLQEAKLNDEGMSSFINGIIGMDPEELQEYAPFRIRYAEAKYEATKAEKLFGSYAKTEIIQRKINEYAADPSDKNRLEVINSLKLTPGFENNEQFIFTRDQAEDIGTFRHLAELPISEETLKKAWLLYADRLNNTLRPVYGILNIFTKNVNSYFLGTSTKEKDRKSYGIDAIANASQLKTATDQAVKAVEESEN